MRCVGCKQHAWSPLRAGVVGVGSSAESCVGEMRCEFGVIANGFLYAGKTAAVGRRPKAIAAVFSKKPSGYSFSHHLKVIHTNFI